MNFVKILGQKKENLAILGECSYNKSMEIKKIRYSAAPAQFYKQLTGKTLTHNEMVFLDAMMQTYPRFPNEVINTAIELSVQGKGRIVYSYLDTVFAHWERVIVRDRRRALEIINKVRNQ